MNPHLDRSIAALRRRAFQGSFLGHLLRGLALCAAVIAAAVLVARVGFLVETRTAALGFVALLLVPLVAWQRALRAVPSRATAAAWLDLRGGGSGALVALDELGDPRWEALLERELRAPRALPAIDVRSPARRALCALALAAAAVLVPAPAPHVGPPTGVQAALLESVEEQLAALEAEVELEPDVALELREALERLREDGALAEPEAAFEALDRAQERLAQEAYERAELAHVAQQALAETAADAAQDPEAAQAALERTLEQLAAAGFSKDVRSALEVELGLAGVELPPGARLAAQDIQRLSRELAERLAARTGGLAQQGLLDAQSLAKLGELAKLDGFAPSAHVCDEECRQHECDASCRAGGTCTSQGRCHRAANGGAPGRGGVSRGRGDAELTWGEETPGAVDRFEPRTLPDARYADPEHSSIVGLGAAAPVVDARAEAPGAGTVQASAGEGAWRRRLAPQHRAAVRTWFGPGGG
ncbi:MAG: hypothetical protein JNK02_05435 [Planctomycetes bacterium]|nr:hypothetical protein [Planctomycetota bacterium]